MIFLPRIDGLENSIFISVNPTIWVNSDLGLSAGVCTCEKTTEQIKKQMRKFLDSYFKFYVKVNQF